jgi:ABC-type antimicrobial peptide transport system permease subunit
MLGGLGLLLGTIGLGAVLLRNVLERRRELALLRALGYRRAHFLAMTVAENALLLGGGLLAGAVCALLAMAPALMEQSGRGPGSALPGGDCTGAALVAAARAAFRVGRVRAETP